MSIVIKHHVSIYLNDQFKSLCCKWKYVWRLTAIPMRNDLIQFTPNIFGSQPLDHGHINREMWLRSSKQKWRGYELSNGTKMG